MKINSIQQICKGAKRIDLYTEQTSTTQWISDGCAFYPLYNLPKLERENVFALFDIPEKKQNKIHFEQKYILPECLDFSDHNRAENLIESGNVAIYARGRVLIPLKTSLGIVYINQKHLTPFKDAENGVQLYERITPSGSVYIAVKEGFLLTGIILPYDIVTKEFVEELKTIYELSAIVEKEKRILPAQGEDPEQIELGEIDE